MDIFIKSFNRAYYLARCIESIRRYVHGRYTITVLDDGTPAPYLARIKRLYPETTIQCSGNYDHKTQAIAAHLSGNTRYADRSIPVEFWKKAVREGSSIFLLLEDDAWLTAPVNLEVLQEVMMQHEVVILKLYWSGNATLVKGAKDRIHDDAEVITPALPFEAPFFVKPFLLNRARLRAVLMRSGLTNTRDHFSPYYALYTVTSALFQKDYWLHVWHNAPAHVNEPLQLYQAYQWQRNHPESRYGKTLSEKIKTSFITSSFNHYPLPFDMLRLNHFLNESWCRGELDVLQNFPADFQISYLADFIPSAVEDCSPSLWQSWIRQYKSDFQSVGCQTD
jgi:GR25 family glycosyltransferase involved in LPS biosynthesis